MRLDEAMDFICDARWVRAKTYEKTSPHEYTVIKAGHPLRERAVRFMEYIFDNGEVEYYYGHPFTVCFIGGRKYWCMAKSKEEISDDNFIINRSLFENAYMTYGNPNDPERIINTNIMRHHKC